VPEGEEAEQEMVMFEVEANVACEAGFTVMLREAVEVLPHASVNDHDSVYVPPPQTVDEPVMVPIAEPLMPHEPLSPLE
jgi:hypothetical protein